MNGMKHMIKVSKRRSRKRVKLKHSINRINFFSQHMNTKSSVIKSLINSSQVSEVEKLNGMTHPIKTTIDLSGAIVEISEVAFEVVAISIEVVEAVVDSIEVEALDSTVVAKEEEVSIAEEASTVGQVSTGAAMEAMASTEREIKSSSIRGTIIEIMRVEMNDIAFLSMKGLLN